MSNRWSLLLASLSLAGAIAVCAHGCGGDDLHVGGMLLATATPIGTKTPVETPTPG